MFYRMRYKRDPPPPSLGPINDSEYTLSHISALVISQQQHATNCEMKHAFGLRMSRKRRLKPSKNSIKNNDVLLFFYKKKHVKLLVPQPMADFCIVPYLLPSLYINGILSGRWRPWWMRCTLPFTENRAIIILDPGRIGRYIANFPCYFQFRWNMFSLTHIWCKQDTGFTDYVWDDFHYANNLLFGIFNLAHSNFCLRGKYRKGIV